MVDDEDYLQLQAADFFAWWVRKGYEEGNIEKILGGDSGRWKGRRIPGVSVRLTEDQLVDVLIALFKSSAPMPYLVNIYDEKRTPRTDRAMSVVELESRQQYLKLAERFLKFWRRKK